MAFDQSYALQVELCQTHVCGYCLPIRTAIDDNKG
jgi:hypothetical protein